MPKVSIIVPVYKVEKSINRCIDSILAQTFTDWELLLVDDGSPDISGEICDKYAEKDSRIRVFHKENGGVSSARNVGIMLASGQWIVFVDSDDYCDAEYLSAFFDIKFNLTQSDIVLQGRKKELNSGVVVGKKILNDGVYENIAEGILTNNLLTFGAPYCKLYSKELIKKYDIRFPENYSFGEDTTFFFKVLSYVTRLITTDKCYYHYIEDMVNSLSKKDHDFELLKDFLLDSMNLVKVIDFKYNMNGVLVNAYIPNYKSLLFRSIISMYRLGYSESNRINCFNKIKRDILPMLSVCRGVFIMILYLLPSFVLSEIFSIAQKIRKIQKKCT